jgi:hypothetical protein
MTACDQDYLRKPAWVFGDDQTRSLILTASRMLASVLRRKLRWCRDCR